MKIISKEDFNKFVDALIQDKELRVEGVKSKKEKFVFGSIESSKELRLDYDVTILPPKKYFLPQYETMMEFDLSNPLNIKETSNGKKLVLIGVHPYDIIAIKQMDCYFLDTDISTSYLKRRKNTIIIGSDVLKVSDRAFFGCMNTDKVENGYDLFLTDLGDRVAIEIGTDIGKKLLDKAFKVREAAPVDIQKVEALRASAKSKAMKGLKIKPQMWHDLLKKNYESDVWKKQSDKCLACGTCTLVCPTCFCYDIVDEIDLDMKGTRKRTWDGCLLRQFTEVASGEIFREDIKERYRHRFQRKGKYLPDRLGFVACVGCGRCSSQCIPDIADPLNLMNMLFDSSEQVYEEKSIDANTIKTKISDIDEDKEHKSLHKPEPATIKRIKKMTEKELFYEIELDSGKALGHQPGQFVEVSIMGMGEAPISISSPPDQKTFDLVVRKIGDVTNKLHEMKKGEKVGIRGPFGKGFDTESLKGKNLVFIAAGLGLPPLRSLIKHVLEPKYRKDYGEITILCGCKQPCEVLFEEEIHQWGKVKDVNILRTVDKCPEGECWEGDIGLITKLIPKVKMDPKNTVAIIVGPPVMYLFCIQILLDMGITDENIIVSLERRMKCGVGKCGHCQINNLYVCKDGPVFVYKDIKDLPEAFA